MNKGGYDLKGLKLLKFLSLPLVLQAVEARYKAGMYHTWAGKERERVWGWGGGGGGLGLVGGLNN